MEYSRYPKGLKTRSKSFFRDQIVKNKRLVVEVVILAHFNTGSKIMLSYAMGWFVNGAVSRRLTVVMEAGLLAIVSLVLGYELSVTMAATQLEITKKIQQSLKRDIYREVLYKNIHLAGKQRWESIFNLTENSIPTLASDYFGNYLANIGRCIQILLCSLALIFVNVDIFLLFVVVSVIPFFLNPIIRRQFGRYKVKLNERTMQHMNFATDVLKGLMTIKAFSSGSFFDEQLQKLDDKLEEQRKQSKLWDIKIGQLSMLLAMSSQIICMLIAALFILRGVITIGDLTVTTQLLNFIVPTITAFNTAYLIGVATKPLQEECQDFLNLRTSQATHEFMYGDIVIQNLSYAYPEGAPIFKDLNVIFESGRKTAVLGKSGCGKSTLMKIIAGELEADAGSLRFGGVSITDIDLIAFHRNVVYVNQTPMIFTGTVLENVTMFGAIKSDLINEVMEELNLTRISNRRIVNGDTELSGGERQRVSLARALLVVAPIIIIDEPDSGQDPETTLTIQKLIFKMKRQTVIVVTHNWQPAYLQKFDHTIKL